MSGLDSVAEVEDLAVRLLALREHSKLELARKLAARGCDPDLAATVLDRLVGSGTLDEARFASVYVEQRARKGFGPLRIRAELKVRGLSDDLIETHLSRQADWEAGLATVHDRRFGCTRPKDRAEYARRGRFLEQRGFPVEMIRRRLDSPD